MDPYQGRDSEVSVAHLLSKPVHFPSSVDENDSLGDCQSFIQITQCVQFPFLRHKTKSIILFKKV